MGRQRTAGTDRRAGAGSDLAGRRAAAHRHEGESESGDEQQCARTDPRGTLARSEVAYAESSEPYAAVDARLHAFITRHRLELPIVL